MTGSSRPGFETQREELSGRRLPVDGTIPAWLSGQYVQNGPGQFEIGGTTLDHWFDSLAMVRGFVFDDGISYTNRFVRSRDFEFARETGQVRTPFPGTPSDRPVWTRLRQLFAGEFLDNPVVGIARLGDQLAAITESPTALTLDPETLETTGRIDLTAGLDVDTTLGHPHYDPRRGALVNLGVEFGREMRYTLFRRRDGRVERTATVDVEDAPYVHSFGLTDRYAVVPSMPFGPNPLSVLLGTVTRRTFVDAFERFDRPGRFHVIDRETGDTVARPRVDPCFIYHQVNAFEDGESIVLDAISYPDDSAMEGLTVANLRSPDPSVPRGNLRRFRLPLDGGPATVRTLREGPMEFPVVDYPADLGRAYDRVFVAAGQEGEGVATTLARVSVPDGEAVTWSEDGCYPGEPMFVRAPPEADSEGVVISVAVTEERSTLLVLDAETMTELARAPLPHRLPYGFHGQFYSDCDPTRSMA
jgi:carotenoid cleavage dioxygenase-like enzyme